MLLQSTLTSLTFSGWGEAAFGKTSCFNLQRKLFFSCKPPLAHYANFLNSKLAEA